MRTMSSTDIKPQNIMRRQKDGKIVLIDFGAVKEILGVELGIAPQPSRSEPDLRLSPHPATG